MMSNLHDAKRLEGFFSRQEVCMEAGNASTSDIVLEGVRKRFELAKGQVIDAVEHVDLNIAAGEFIWMWQKYPAAHGGGAGNSEPRPNKNSWPNT